MNSAHIEPQVSVVVPAWGDYAGKALAEALESLHAQDLPARVIVVDNASAPPLGPMEGAEVLRSDSRLSLGAARNLGLEAVRSPYVVLWDADDLMLPGTLRFLRDRIASQPDAVLVATSILEGDPPVPHRWPRRWIYPLARRRSLFAFADCVWSVFPTTGAAIMRTAVAQECGYGDASGGEDWVLGVSLAFRGGIVLDPRPGRVYRRHPDSVWATQRALPMQVRHGRAVRERLERDPGVPDWVKRVLPAIAALQLVAIFVLHPLAVAGRAIRTSGRSGM